MFIKGTLQLWETVIFKGLLTPHHFFQLCWQRDSNTIPSSTKKTPPIHAHTNTGWWCLLLLSASNHGASTSTGGSFFCLDRHCSGGCKWYHNVLRHVLCLQHTNVVFGSVEPWIGAGVVGLWPKKLNQSKHNKKYSQLGFSFFGKLICNSVLNKFGIQIYLGVSSNSICKHAALRLKGSAKKTIFSTLHLLRLFTENQYTLMFNRAITLYS